MTRDFDGEIAEIEATLSSTQDMLVLPRQDFVAACTDFIRKWYFDETDQHVEDSPRNTKRLGREKLSRLKDKVRTLQTSVAGLITDLLDDEKLWWSLTRDGCFFPTKSETPHQFNRPLRLAAGRLAPILEEFGYIAPQGANAWRERTRKRANIAINSARPYFPGRLDWSEEMVNAAAEYNEITKKCEGFLRDIDELKEQKSRSEALELWHSA